MAIIPESNYVKVSFAYKQGANIIGTLPKTVLFFQGTTGTTSYVLNSMKDFPSALQTTSNAYKGAELYFANGGQTLILYKYTSDSETTAIASCLETYPDVVCYTFAEAVDNKLSSILGALDADTNLYRGFLLYASNTAKATLMSNIGDHTNIGLLWLPSGTSTDYGTYSALALAGKLSTFDATIANGITDLQFLRVSGLDAIAYDNATPIDTKIADGYNVIANIGGRATVLDGAKMIDGEPIHAKWGTCLLETLIRQNLMDALINGLPYSAQSDGAISNIITNLLNQFVTNGLISAGAVYHGETSYISYNGRSYKAINANEVLENGYKVAQISIGEASTTDATARRTPPINIYCLIAGRIRVITVQGEVRV